MLENTLWAHFVIEELLQQGVGYFCISPGSRNTPLVLAASMHKTMVHFDERGTAFHALGYAKGSGKAACLIITSASAVGNLLPAIMEAHYSHVPMIILTGDRPPELRECGANQTVEQPKIFQDFVRWQVDLPVPDPSIKIDYLRSCIAYGVFQAKTGPVHINCMYREPLYVPGQKFPEERLQYPKTEYFHPELIGKCNLSLPKKGLILIGRMKCKKAIPAIYALAERLRWPIFPDLLSLSRLYPPHSHCITSYDNLLKTTAVETPEAILHFGDRFISKKLLEWLTEIKPALYVSVIKHQYRHDPTHLVTHRFFCDPKSFCASIGTSQIDPDWLPYWQEKEEIAKSVIQNHLAEEKGSEPHFASTLPLPKDWAVFFGNSMPIRDADQFFHPKEGLAGIFANRGTSGIDGNIATAIGISVGLQKPIAIIIGDQAFLHDMNSIAQIKKSPYPILLFVINNGGGCIFSHLAVGKFPKVDEFFKAKHEFTFAGVAETFGIPYYNQFVFPNHSAIIEITTSDEKNVECYNKLRKKLQEALLLCPTR